MTPAPRGRPFRPGQSGNPGGRPRVVGELRELARAHAPEAIEELARLAMKARSESARVAAIRELLDRGYGKPTQFLATDNEASWKHMTLDELNAEILSAFKRLFPGYRLVPPKQLTLATSAHKPVYTSSRNDGGGAESPDDPAILPRNRHIGRFGN